MSLSWTSASRQPGTGHIHRLRERIPRPPSWCRPGLDDETIASRPFMMERRITWSRGRSTERPSSHDPLRAIEGGGAGSNPERGRDAEAVGRQAVELPEPPRSHRPDVRGLRTTSGSAGTTKPTGFFRHLDIKLWEDVRHNPVQLLKEVDRQRFEEVMRESVFMQKYRLRA